MLEKDSIYVIVILFTIMFTGCGNKDDVNKAFVLEKFAIDNVMLDTIIQSVCENKTKAFPNIESDTQKVLSLNLHHKDSVILFVFSFSSPKELIFDIYRDNYRIVGYTEYEKRDLILLSNVNHISDFGRLFAEFIHPTENKKTFDYMYFPDDLYSGKANGTWPNYEMMYDPMYLVYKYKEGIFLPPILTTNWDSKYWYLDLTCLIHTLLVFSSNSEILYQHTQHHVLNCPNFISYMQRVVLYLAK